MKTTNEIYCDNLVIELKQRGIDAHYSTSNTDFGTSHYFTFYKNSETLERLKLRISDHSVSNIYRIENERHVYPKRDSIERTANAVELYLFPERFIFIADNNKPTHIIKGVKGYYTRVNK